MFSGAVLVLVHLLLEKCIYLFICLFLFDTGVYTYHLRCYIYQARNLMALDKDSFSGMEKILLMVQKTCFCNELQLDLAIEHPKSLRSVRRSQLLKLHHKGSLTFLTHDQDLVSTAPEAAQKEVL